MNRRNWRQNKKQANPLELIMKTYKLIYNNRFAWAPVNAMGLPAACYLRVYDNGGGHIVAIAKEIKDNTGRSITNGAEDLWLAVDRRFGRVNTKLETYDDRAFDRVIIKDKKATWERYYTKDNKEDEEKEAYAV